MRLTIASVATLIVVLGSVFLFLNAAKGLGLPYRLLLFLTPVWCIVLLVRVILGKRRGAR